MRDFIKRLIEYYREEERRYIITYRWLLGLLLVFALYYVMIISVRPVLHFEYVFPVDTEKRKGGLTRDFNSYYLIPDSLEEQSRKLASNEAFLLAKLEMAKEDTISMVLDLPDSTVSLSIQGVNVYESHITGFRYSKIFIKSDPFLTAKFFSWPFKVENYSSSVPKIPVILRKAPKDTIEAASLPEPDVLQENHQFVSFRLKLDRKLNLVFEQDSISDTIDKKSIKNYLRQQKKTIRKSIRKALIWSEPYEYVPEIRISLDRNDALVIFRAIPENADITIRLVP